MKRKISIKDFSYDPQLGRSLEICLTVKNTALTVAENDHLKRFNNNNNNNYDSISNSNSNSNNNNNNNNIIGVMKERNYHNGLVIAASLNSDNITNDNGNGNGNVFWKKEYPEVHGVSFFKDQYLVLSGANYVSLYDFSSGKITEFYYPWFQHLHTVEFSRDGSKLLVASMGFDIVVEFDWKSGEITWEWCAWDHEFHQSPLGHHVVRSQEKADAIRNDAIINNNNIGSSNNEIMVVDDPSKYCVFGLPTRLRAVGLNAVTYDGSDASENSFLATFFHTGIAVSIDRVTKKSSVVIKNLVGPHGFSKLVTAAMPSSMVVSSTRVGEFLLRIHRSECDAADYSNNNDDEDNDDNSNFQETVYTLKGLPGVVRNEELGEWVQTTKYLANDVFACLDIHRAKVWLVNLKQKTYRGVSISREWAIQDIYLLPVQFQTKMRDFKPTFVEKKSLS